MSTWTKQKFKNFASLQRGFDLPQQDRIAGEVPVVASTSITAYHNQFKVKAPCVTTGRSGALGEVLYIDVDCWPLNTALWVKNFHGNNPKFVYFKMKTLGLEKFNAGAGVPTLNKNHLDTLEVSVPDLPTQTRIASLLSAYDDLIENNEKRIKALEEMAQLLYTEWFVKFKFPRSTSSGQAGHEKVKLVDSGNEYGKIPEGWEVGILDKISTLIKKKFIEKEDRNLPLVDMARINHRNLSITNIGHSSELSTSRIIFNTNDILFGSIRPYLYKVALASFQGVTNISVFVLRAKESYLKAFHTITLFRNETVNWANHHSAGTKMPVIKWELFKKMPLLIPGKEILERYNNIVGSVLDQINELSIINRNISKTRDLLIPQLVTGKRELK
ncbi:MAG: restriction endonuclease subunit S [Bacteroidetes bacterium]|nr:restriction endonuclease subunit S [Bacteroidota bacterium]